MLQVGANFDALQALALQAAPGFGDGFRRAVPGCRVDWRYQRARLNPNGRGVQAGGVRAFIRAGGGERNPLAEAVDGDGGPAAIGHRFYGRVVAGAEQAAAGKYFIDTGRQSKRVDGQPLVSGHARPRAQIDRVKLGGQLRQRNLAAQGAVQPDVPPQPGHLLKFGLPDGRGQDFRGEGPQLAAQPGCGLKNGYGIAFAGQIVSGGQAAQAAADYRHPLPPPGRNSRRRRFSAKIGAGPFQRGNGQGVAHLGPFTNALAGVRANRPMMPGKGSRFLSDLRAASKSPRAASASTVRISTWRGQAAVHSGACS